ncbi:unnamed protein product [Thlaspi arvense]|uniref:threonine--tRNA ligase n=1 Tax=Thlaspi arvense TaxID=13288 RepID=A0AAU9R928_THLAR|nr:unnamed protein product [Thlaspi arvense]
MDIAAQISNDLANSALVSSVNGVLWDMNKPLEGDCSLEFFKFESDEGRDTLWRSSALILVQVLEQEYGCKLCIESCTNEGFFYDAFYGDLGLNDKHFPKTEAAVSERQPFERVQMTKDEALEMFSDNSFKVELINDIPEDEDKTVTVYRCGLLVDLCNGPHVPNTSSVKAFKCLNASSAYWKGLRSLYFHEHGVLKEFIEKEYKKRRHKEVESPILSDMELWGISGHAAKTKARSYRDFPIRMAEFGVLHRNEASGALSGMTRVRQFVQDDAHIFCRADQVEEEVKGVLDFVDYAYNIFGFSYELKLSTRPEKYLGDIETWDKAEEALKKALVAFGKPWRANEGDGAFYGPKIDITVSDAMTRRFQCATLQLDFQLPARFKLEYTSKDQEKRERPVMIHRAVLGSIERMFAILLEHYKGILPFWLSPRQAIVCTLSEGFSKYAEKVRDQIEEAGYNVEVDLSDRKIGKKVREAQAAPFNYILVVGEREATTGHVTVRLREDPPGRKDLPEMSIENLLDEFKFKTDNFL